VKLSGFSALGRNHAELYLRESDTLVVNTYTCASALSKKHEHLGLYVRLSTSSALVGTMQSSPYVRMIPLW
jgi:hypothetical protein